MEHSGYSEIGWEGRLSVKPSLFQQGATYQHVVKLHHDMFIIKIIGH